MRHSTVSSSFPDASHALNLLTIFVDRREFFLEPRRRRLEEDEDEEEEGEDDGGGGGAVERVEEEALLSLVGRSMVEPLEGDTRPERSV
jgi:hypothetical protein